MVKEKLSQIFTQNFKSFQWQLHYSRPRRNIWSIKALGKHKHSRPNRFFYFHVFFHPQTPSPTFKEAKKKIDILTFGSLRFKLKKLQWAIWCFNSFNATTTENVLDSRKEPGKWLYWCFKAAASHGRMKHWNIDL